MVDRRHFLRSAAFLTGGAMLSGSVSADQQTNKRPLIISTWKFGKQANDKALNTILHGGSTLDGVEQGIRVIEDSGNSSVGLSGTPNAAGFSQLDACIMHGPGHTAGGVAAIEGFKHPISVARRVMDKSPHVLLAGDGARWFALEEGFESVDISKRPQQAKAWRQRDRDPKPKQAPAGGPDNHDTITVLVLGADGTISGGCSTSGLGGKLPGRVGDSPIIGSGLYVDNEVGAAGATGIGENVMRYCASFLIVEFMRQGLHPTEACKKAISRLTANEPKGKELAINFIALDKQGRFGAAGTDDFPHAVTYPGYSEVLTVAAS
ncbi:MAG: N(4)-(beta-N-acetylglucosaminyl)-L-asparaginase [Pirellulaceae bacterium]|nr:N(4)-(beta-N-acetylglucosaminyl)-L-asparaginase [Pirellulaceae bacterium]